MRGMIRMKGWICGAALVALSLSQGGCLNERLEFQRIVLSGDATSSAEGSGPILGELLFAWSGEGALRHPLEPFGTFELPGPGPFELTIDYPIGEGEDLALYAFHDTDGDGLLCSIGAPREPSGLSILELTPEPSGPFALTSDLTLDTECAGPEALYP